MIRKVGIHVLSKNVWVTSNMLRDFRKIWEFRLCIPNHGADLIRADLVLLGIKFIWSTSTLLSVVPVAQLFLYFSCTS